MHEDRNPAVKDSTVPECVIRMGPDSGFMCTPEPVQTLQDLFTATPSESPSGPAAVKGRANAACVGALAAALEVRPSSVILTAQSRGRRKRVRIQGNPAELAVRLRALASQGGIR